MSCVWLRSSEPYFAKLDIQTEAERERLENLIAGSVQFLETACHRKFLQQEHDAVFDTVGSGMIALRHHPISHVSRVCARQLEVLTIANTTAQVANWAVNETSLILTRYTSGVKAVSTLALASYATLTALETAIKALGNGWSAETLTGWGSYPVADLVCPQFGNAKAVTSLWLWDDYQGSFDFDGRTGLVYGGFSGRVRVVYTGGFEQIPDDLKATAANLAIIAYEENKPSQEMMGNYMAIYLDPNKLAMSDKRVISYYKDHIC